VQRRHEGQATVDRSIFGVEVEVAGAIAQALKAELSGAEQQAVAARPTDNPAAYDAYLRGQAQWGTDYDFDSVRKAIAAYEQAVRLDPGFALAWSWLSISESYLFLNGVEPDQITADSVRRAEETALRLRPELTEVRLAHGYYLYRVQRDLPAAPAEFESAQAQAPNTALVLIPLALVERRLGRWDEALAHLQQAATVDPRNAGLMTTLGGETLGNMLRWEEDRQWLDRAIAVNPNAMLAVFYKIFSYQSEGRLQESARVLQAIAPADEDPMIATRRIYQAMLERRYDAAIAEAQSKLTQPEASLNGQGPWLRYGLAQAQLCAGQAAQAKTSFERLIAQIGPDGAVRVDDATLPVLLALAYAGAGQPQAAEKQGRRAVELYRSDAIEFPIAQEALAQVQAWAGQLDAAVDTLSAVQNRYGRSSPALLRLDPAWDPLRNNPRFRKMVADGEAQARVAAK
jgi:tetratricopeptide (TPR) repeat protein